MSNFQDLAHFNPFSKITIASACSWDLRLNRLEPDTIASNTLTGWRRSVNHSKFAIGWLLREQQHQGIQIQHATNEGEYIVPDTRCTVDGFHAPSRTIYEFYGCFYHGFPSCYKDRYTYQKNLLNRTVDDAYNTTKRAQVLRNKGYTVMWECEWRYQQKINPTIYDFLDNQDIQEPLNLRDAFFGLRTNAARLHCTAQPGMKIRYYDYTSLYPWMNKKGRYPISHLTFIYAHASNNLTPYFGLAKVTILPPESFSILFYLFDWMVN